MVWLGMKPENRACAVNLLVPLGGDRLRPEAFQLFTFSIINAEGNN